MRIAAYCRVSTGNDDQLDSLKNQKEFFIQYAAQHNHELISIYADEGISGTSLNKRAEFKNMMRDASEKQFEMVVVKDISRFSRNTVDFLQAIRELKSHGINTVFVNSNMESFGESEFILTVFSALAQEESINISKRVKFGKRLSAQKGCVPHSIFGYQRIDNFTLEIDPDEALIVESIFTMYVDEGLGCRRISAELNRRGYRTKTYGEWSPKAVLRVLKNSIYCGEYVNAKYEISDCISKKITRIPPEKNLCHQRSEWAIVSKEVFDKAQYLLQKKGKKFAPNANFVQTKYGTKHAFSTLIKCEECGRSFTRKTYKGKGERVYWKCPTNDQFTSDKCPNRTVVDEVGLLQKIGETVYSSLEDTDRFLRDVSIGIISLSQKKIESLKKDKKLDLLKRKRERVIDLYTDGIISLEEFAKRIKLLSDDIMHLGVKKGDPLSENDSFGAICEKARFELESLFTIGEIENHEMRKIVQKIIINTEGDIKIYLV